MANKKIDARAVWFVAFPTHQYKEDVMSIARKGDYRIVDARYKGNQKQVEKAPKLTIKEEYIPKKTEIELLREEVAALKAGSAAKDK